MTADQDKIEKVVRIIAEGRAMGVTILPPDINESQTDFTVVYACAERRLQSRRAARRSATPASPQIRFGLGAVRGIGDSALRRAPRGARGGRAVPRSVRLRRARRRAPRQQGHVRVARPVRRVRPTLGPARHHAARAHAAVDLALERSRSASQDRERGQTTCSRCSRTARAATWSPRADRVPAARALGSARDAGARKAGARLLRLGAPARSLRQGAAPLRRRPRPSRSPGLAQWAKVRVAGVVENYRDRIFKNGGGRVVFFELEDEVGRVDVKVAEKQIEACAACSRAASRCSSKGRSRFP